VILFLPIEGGRMAGKKGKQHQQLFTFVLQLSQDRTREVKAKASTREIAERRALKFNPDAIGVKRG
jgi:hypothetical protein